MLLPIVVLRLLHFCKNIVSIQIRRVFTKTLVQLGSVSPILALYIFVIGVLFLSATVRILCFLLPFGMCLASVGHVTPHAGAVFVAFL